MIGATEVAQTRGSAPMIAGLTVLVLGALAFAVPRAPIAFEGRGGLLLSHSRVSYEVAEQIASAGYAYLVVDLTSARVEKDALWWDHFKAVSQSGTPLWGWVDVRGDLDQAERVVRELPLDGLLVYGPDAAEHASRLGEVKSELRVIPVLPKATAAGGHAVALDLDAFLTTANDVMLPVLIADGLDAAQIARARAAVDGDYIVAKIAIVD